MHVLFAPEEGGQGIVEYALILALIAVAVILILSIIGTSIQNVFQNIMANM